jgi:hypothetical protein
MHPMKHDFGGMRKLQKKNLEQKPKSMQRAPQLLKRFRQRSFLSAHRL